jgi:hypothetical protein
MNEGGNSMMSGDIDMGMAWNIGKAVAEWLTMPGYVVVVHVPMRQNEARAIIEGLRLQGRDVADRGHGDVQAAKEYLRNAQGAGAVVVGQVGDAVTIEICQADGHAVTGAVLQRLWEQAAAGNFIPAAVKGNLLG